MMRMAAEAKETSEAGVGNLRQQADQYRSTGFLVRRWAHTATLERLNAVCHDIFQGRITDGYQQSIHYEGMACEVNLDHQYDSVFCDALFENDLPLLMQKLVGDNAVLYHINAITSLAPGYMTEWHTDEFERASHKLIFYPIFDGAPDPCIQVAPGRIRPVASAPGRWRSNRYSTWIEASCSTRQTVTRSSDTYVLLNTETLHRAMPVRDPAGVFRLIYNFVEWFKDGEEQRPIKNASGNKMSINEELIAYYRDRLARQAPKAGTQGMNPPPNVTPENRSLPFHDLCNPPVD